MVNSPIQWFGGKRYLLPELLPRIPKHIAYVEVFGGGGRLLFAKSSSISETETYNDLDEHLADFFRVLQNDSDREALINRLKYTLHSRAEFYRYRESWQTETDRIERIAQWFVVARQSFSGVFGGSWSYSRKKNRSRVYKNVVNSLDAVADRVRDWQIECKDWRDMLDVYDTTDTFFYLDPPYIHSTRTSSNEYAHEMTDDDHRDLIERIQTLEGKVMLSGYNHPIYENLPWERTDIEAILWAVNHSKQKGRRPTAIESIWCNYEIDSQLALF